MQVSNWREFARHCILADDLDPVYGFLYKIRMDKGTDWANRFVLHMLMFYDIGGAARCADQTSESDFWYYVLTNYAVFKRGTERRHSRGELGLRYARALSEKGTPRDIMRAMYAPQYHKLVKIFNSDLYGCGFGPYFIWKVMDYQDRVFERPVSISLAEAVKHMPDEPKKSANFFWPELSLAEVLRKVSDAIEDLPAPGAPDRRCSYPEAETVLCELKNHLAGTYRIGDDIEKRYKQLADFPHLHQYLPPRQDWSKYVRPSTLDAKTVSADQLDLAPGEAPLGAVTGSRPG